jgi:SAM-dependent methyltransferase
MMVLPTTMTTCQVCRDSTGEFVTAREMMYGTRETFTYFECGTCGCLQLVDVPSNLAPYYPTDYYSLRPAGTVPERSAFRKWLNDYRNAGTLFGHDLLSWLFSKLRPGTDLSTIAHWFWHTRIRTFKTRILDVGCGSGDLLIDMADAGFRYLVGIDPYATPRADLDGRVRILRTNLNDFDGVGFDLVMCHHALEHMPDQIGMLRQMNRVLHQDGVCLIRIPIASSEVWRRYRENWVELDPPRHLVVHSRQSFETAAHAAGFRIERTEYEESAFGYWGSELYSGDLSLVDPASGQPRRSMYHFSADQLAEFAHAAQAANARCEGGRAAFYLRKYSPGAPNESADAPYGPGDTRARSRSG